MSNLCQIRGELSPKAHATDASLDILFLNPNVCAERADGATVGTIGVPEDYIVRCINTGILSIVTYLDGKGYRTAVLDFLDDPNPARLREFLSRERPLVIGISCMTGFSYIHSQELARTARECAPEALIVMGSQHVGPQAVAVLDDCSAVDAVALYEGEIVCERLIKVCRGEDSLGDIPGLAWRNGKAAVCNQAYPPQVELGDLPPLRYDLYPRFRSFHAYVEESRGCFAKCEFCITPFTNEYRIRGKPAQRILYEADRAAEMWGSSFEESKPLALLASTFGANPVEAWRLVDGLGQRGMRWTSEFRADGPLAKQISRVADGGAVALFVGVESASPTQLVRMVKTTRADLYLRSLTGLLRDAENCPSVLVKLGFLVYIGESAQTMRETLDFLIAHQKSISWISVSPLFVFGGTPLDQRFAEYSRDYGASLHREGFWGRSRTYACNVSPDFPFHESIEAARFLEKLFRRKEAFDRVFERKSSAGADA